MAIPAKRFSFLDKETNLPTIDLLSIKNTDVYNSVKETISTVNTDVTDFLKKPAIQDIINPIQDFKDKADRVAKDINGSIKDISKLSTKDVDKLIVGLFPENSLVRSIAGQLTDKCKTKAFGSNINGKPYDATINCNGKKKNSPSNACSPSQLSNLLDKLTNGEYKSQFNDLNEAFKAIIALSKLGYDFNMCGVFSALMSSLPNKDMLGKAASTVLGYLAAAKNIDAMLDMASSTTELNVKKGSHYLFNNFKLPNDLKEYDYYNYLNTVCEAADIYDIDWAKSTIDEIPSIAIMDEYNEVLDKVMVGRRYNNKFNSNDLDSIVTDDCDFMSVAYTIKKEQTNDFKIFA